MNKKKTHEGVVPVDRSKKQDEWVTIGTGSIVFAEDHVVNGLVVEEIDEIGPIQNERESI